MDDEIRRPGYFSILRWGLDPTRDEAKNVAVVLVDQEGTIGGFRAAPVSSISRRLHEQGIVDTILQNVNKQFESAHRPSLGMLIELQRSMKHSLQFTEPKPTLVGDSEIVLNALYQAYVAPRGGGSQTMTKGRALDRVVESLRRRGHEVRRGDYFGDFLFDAIIDGQRDVAVEVLSFATTAQKWTPVEHDAGHFLFALERVGIPGVAVLFRPSDSSHQNAVSSYDRICRWFAAAGVQVADPESVENVLVSLS